MSKRHWMPLYIPDYLADTAHLTATESGAYLHLIMHYWTHEELPKDERALARIARIDGRQWHIYRETLLSFFRVDDLGNRTHKRIDYELSRCSEISNKRKGAAMQMHSKRYANAEQVHTQLQPHTQKEVSKEAIPLSSGDDPKKVLFGIGVNSLCELGGMATEKARSVIGRWLKSYPPDRISAAIREAYQHRAMDPIPYITATLKGKPNGKRINGQSSHERGSGITLLAALAGYGDSERSGSAPGYEHAGPTIDLDATELVGEPNFAFEGKNL